MTRQRLVGHYWDGKDELVEAYKPILQTKRDDSDEYLKAWDVYCSFIQKRNQTVGNRSINS